MECLYANSIQNGVHLLLRGLDVHGFPVQRRERVEVVRVLCAEAAAQADAMRKQDALPAFARVAQGAGGLHLTTEDNRGWRTVSDTDFQEDRETGGDPGRSV